MNENIAGIRKDYIQETLLEKNVADDPITQFSFWWNEAVKSEIEEVNAMTLATCSKDAIPSARIVLLKGFSIEGFTFFTNYQSYKGQNLHDNPHASLVFFWKELERQIRIDGTVEKINEQASDEYFASRPVASQIGAWSSPQSNVIENREVIEQNVLKFFGEFEKKPIVRPPHWGGYIVKPVSIEFWQGRSSRLHDRILYTLEEGKWTIKRLAP